MPGILDKYFTTLLTISWSNIAEEYIVHLYYAELYALQGIRIFVYISLSLFRGWLFCCILFITTFTVVVDIVCVLLEMMILYMQNSVP